MGSVPPRCFFADDDDDDKPIYIRDVCNENCKIGCFVKKTQASFQIMLLMTCKTQAVVKYIVE